MQSFSWMMLWHFRFQMRVMMLFGQLKLGLICPTKLFSLLS